MTSPAITAALGLSAAVGYLFAWFIYAVRDRAVCMMNRFSCKLLHKKASLAVLSDERNAGLFTRAELEQCIARWRGTRMPVPDSLPPAAELAERSPPVLDSGVLGELREVLGAEVDKIIAVYLEDAPRLIAQLERAAVSNDPIALRVAAR